jgi:hypothetical protein
MTTTNINAKVIQLKQKINQAISNEEIKQSGSNEHLKVEYWKIDNFLPHAIKFMNELKINDRILVSKENGCRLYFENGEEPYDSVLSVEIPYEDAEMLGKGGTPSKVDKIQRLGASLSYLRRYILEIALALPKNDDVENLMIQETLKEIETRAKIKNDVRQILIDLPYDNGVKGWFKDKILEHYKEKDWKDLIIDDYAEALQLINDLKEAHEQKAKEKEEGLPV